MPDTPRRGFLHKLVGSLAGLAIAPSIGSSSGAQSPDESWLQGLSGKHKQILDVTTSRGGTPLARTANFLDAYAEAYGMKDSDLNAVVGLHGGALVIALNDALWSKYELGKRSNELDTNQKAYTRNPFASGSATSVARLQQRGVRFIACSRSIRRLAGELAAGSGGADEIRAELHANLLPGVVAVPAMIVAVNRAQEAGLTYVALG